MRIIAGKYRGLTLKAVSGMATRPTQDRVREALFSILGDFTDGARVLDLFAGTGALGLEAMSRGGEHVTFVEMSKNALVVLQANISATRCPHYAVLPIPVDRAIRKLAADKARFDLIFLDPPYGRNLAHTTVAALVASGILDPGARIVAEHETRGEMPPQLGDWFRTDSRRYGDSTLSIYARMNDAL